MLKYEDEVWKTNSDSVKQGQKVKDEGQNKVIFVDLEYQYILTVQ